jgi:hypothetical protein
MMLLKVPPFSIKNGYEGKNNIACKIFLQIQSLGWGVLSMLSNTSRRSRTLGTFILIELRKEAIPCSKLRISTIKHGINRKQSRLKYANVSRGFEET